MTHLPAARPLQAMMGIQSEIKLSLRRAELEFFMSPKLAMDGRVFHLPQTGDGGKVLVQ